MSLTKHELNEDELQYLNSLTKITPSDQLIDDLFGDKNYTRIPKFFYTADNKLEKVLLSLDKPHVKSMKDIKYVMDKGSLTAYVPVNSIPTIKTPWEVFYDKFNP